MKCWWVVVVGLLIPTAVLAEDVGEPAVEIGILGMKDVWPSKGAGWEFLAFSFFGVEAKERLTDVKIYIEFSLPTGSWGNPVPTKAGRCEVFQVTKGALTPQVFSIGTDKDLHLWVPYLEVGTGLGVAVGWESTKNKIWTATLTLESSEGIIRRRWENWILQWEKMPNRPPTIYESLGQPPPPHMVIPLGTVCERLEISELPIPPS